jgi:hypothetical protein
LKTSTIGRRLAALKYAHDLAGAAFPADSKMIKTTMAGIRRSLGSAPTKKAPATADILRNMVSNSTDETLKGKRDKALLLLGFAGAFRRSELVARLAAQVGRYLARLCPRCRAVQGSRRRRPALSTASPRNRRN